MTYGHRQSRRLFILGAGCSYAVGLPDAARVLTQLFGYTGGAPYPLVRNRTPMGVFKAVSNALMSYAMQAGFRSGDRFPIDAIAESFYKALPQGYEAFVLLMQFWQALREFIFERSVVCAGGYQTFADSLLPGDVVITFNWDTCLEIALYREGKPCSLSFQEPISMDKIRILKPHGSVDFTVAEGYAPQRPAHDFIELVHPALPELQTIEGIKRPQLYRILTYDLPFSLEVTWAEGNLQISWSDAGDPKPAQDFGEDVASVDVGAMHLERFLLEAFPFLLTPGSPATGYEWSYASIRQPLEKIASEFKSVHVCGYSFPPYDAGVLKTLTTLKQAIGDVPVHVISPSPSSLPQNTLKRVFGRFELYDKGFQDFDWAAA